MGMLATQILLPANGERERQGFTSMCRGNMKLTDAPNEGLTRTPTNTCNSARAPARYSILLRLGTQRLPLVVLVTSATLVVTGALLVVTKSY